MYPSGKRTVFARDSFCMFKSLPAFAVTVGFASLVVGAADEVLGCSLIPTDENGNSSLTAVLHTNG